MTDTTSQHISARDDKDLIDRLIAAAEQAHIPSPESFVRMNVGKLISAETTPGSTITTVHAYASTVRQTALDLLPPLPGVNPAAVTDVQLAQAVRAVWAPEVN